MFCLFKRNRATLLWRVLPPVLYRFSQHSTLLSVKIPENNIPGEGRHACWFTLPYRPVSRSWRPAWLSCLFLVNDVVFPFPSSAFFFLFCFTACAPISRYLPLTRRSSQTWKEHQKKHTCLFQKKKSRNDILSCCIVSFIVTYRIISDRNALYLIVL